MNDHLADPWVTVSGEPVEERRILGESLRDTTLGKHLTTNNTVFLIAGELLLEDMPYKTCVEYQIKLPSEAPHYGSG